MPARVSVLNRQKQVRLDGKKIGAAARKILEVLGYEGTELTVVIVDDEEITRLNRQYFRRNRPTNVISFPLNDGQSGSPPSGALGDVVISAETARRDAREAGGEGSEEILFLLIHGILHLAGYDHEGAKAERARMEAKERELFSLLRRPAAGASPAVGAKKKNAGRRRSARRPGIGSGNSPGGNQ